jgi:hypothetical protein
MGAPANGSAHMPTLPTDQSVQTIGTAKTYRTFESLAPPMTAASRQQSSPIRRFARIIPPSLRQGDSEAAGNPVRAAPVISPSVTL